MIQYPIGVDILEWKKASGFYWQHRARLAVLLHPGELAFVKKARQPTQAFAQVFSAKEAVFKAIGASWLGVSGFKNIEILPKKSFSFRLKGALKKNFPRQRPLKISFKKKMSLHRCPMRWDLIDRFEILKKGEISRAHTSFDGSEDFFAEHDPGRPRVPEPLFLEMIAQAGGVLFGLGIDFKKEVILAKIEGASFKRTVMPPCEFIVEARIEDQREEGAWISGSVSQGREVVATARILLVTMEPLTDSGGMVVFNDRFLKHYDVYNVARRSQGVGV